MSVPDRLVVVTASVSVARYAQTQMFSARFADLGITSFGTSPEDAIAELKNHYRFFIDALREEGVLEQTLNDLGAQWWWADEYPEDKPPYENTREEESDQKKKLRQALSASQWNPADAASSSQSLAAAA